MILADCLFALKKISASVANNWKYQFDQFLKVAEYDHKEEFLNFSFKKDCLGRFCAPFFFGSHTCNKVWVICKIVFYYHMVKASQKEDSALTVKWLTIMYRRNTWHCKALCIMQFVMLVLTFFWNYTCYDEKLSVILPKVQSGIWKKKMPKIKQVTMQIWNKKKIDLEATIKALKDGTSTTRRHWWQ